MAAPSNPTNVTAALVLGDGTVLWGQGVGAVGSAVGEVCFNTAITGYQEILTDPSYAGQIITFTFPHIGNVGANDEDVEAVTPLVRGLVLRSPISEASNWRAVQSLDSWLKTHGLVGIAGVDTRHLTRRIRDGGAPNGTVCHASDGVFDLDYLTEQAKNWPGLNGMDLAGEVTCGQAYKWEQSCWALGRGYGTLTEAKYHVVAMDFGAKHNILRCLANSKCRVTVVPATTSADDVMRYQPDGIFLSNGPGDPSATAVYAVATIKSLLATNLPIFGICLGHQLLAIALGARTEKMLFGHRGANHPVKDLKSGRVEITSQNHGFVVKRDSLPKDVIATHESLFDGSLEGIALKDRKVFSVQYHPESSPGPQDSHYLFDRFVAMMENI